MTPEEEFVAFTNQPDIQKEVGNIWKVDAKAMTIQFCGWEVVLFPNGTYYFSDTSG